MLLMYLFIKLFQKNLMWIASSIKCTNVQIKTDADRVIKRNKSNVTGNGANL